MYIVGIVFFLYSVILVIFFGSRVSKLYLKFPYYLFFLFLSYFVGLNIENLSRDYLNYAVWFKNIQNYNLLDILFSGGADLGKDFGFQFLVALIQKTISYENYTVYFILSYLILLIKYNISSFLNSNLAVILALWLIFTQTFVLFEITQIRAGLAICLSTYAFMRALFEEKNSKLNLLFFLLALSIHISTVVIFAIYLIYIIKRKIFSRGLIVFLILSSVIFNYFFSTSIGSLFITYFSGNLRFSDYLDSGESLSLLSVFLIAKVLVITILLFFWKNINNAKRYIVFLSAIGCFFQISLSSNAVFGLRFAELFILFSILTFVFPLQIKCINNNVRNMYFIFLVFLSFAFYYSSMKIILS